MRLGRFVFRERAQAQGQEQIRVGFGAWRKRATWRKSAT
jgi:hypothetical protein